MDIPFLVLVVIITALVFDFTNGFHDTANAMATSIATGALRPKVAVAIAGVLNLVGAFISTAVAKTISGGLVDDTKVTPAIIFGGLIGAIIWNLVTWLVGLPSSSSHALFGGLIGAVWVAAGSGAVHFDVVVEKVLVPAVASPLVCGVVAAVGTFLAYKLTRRAPASRRSIAASVTARRSRPRWSRSPTAPATPRRRWASSPSSSSRPATWVRAPVRRWWVVLLAGLAIAAGTYAGGWRIIRTMGKGITDIEAPQGFAAETSSTAVLLASSHLGFALSTTQVCSGGILGAGVGRRLAEVRWTVARRMALAWLFTLPVAAVVGGLSAKVAVSGNAGVALVSFVALGLMAAIYAYSRRAPVNADNVNEPATVELAPVPVLVAAA